MNAELQHWPFIDFQAMSKAEIRDYFSNFVNAIPRQIQALEIAVRSQPGFEGWRADETQNSLLRLGEWMAKQVQTRPRSTDELDRIRAGLSFEVPVANWELTDQTFTDATRVGIYLAQVLAHGRPDLRWTYKDKPRNHADYGQPVLAGFGKMVFNPVRIGTVLARGIADRTLTADRLFQLHKFWSRPQNGSAEPKIERASNNGSKEP
jgi:hypothetical protein